ncbi:MAG: hypothetical protein L6R39_001900 [Caloplaca ligustica]|nr:MAG: hypothetical protein L6R39_001900 [Caloplaca ligustica]
MNQQGGSIHFHSSSPSSLPPPNFHASWDDIPTTYDDAVLFSSFEDLFYHDHVDMQAPSPQATSYWAGSTATVSATTHPHHSRQSSPFQNTPACTQVGGTMNRKRDAASPEVDERANPTKRPYKGCGQASIDQNLTGCSGPGVFGEGLVSEDGGGHGRSGLEDLGGWSPQPMDAAPVDVVHFPARALVLNDVADQSAAPEQPVGDTAAAETNHEVAGDGGLRWTRRSLKVYEQDPWHWSANDSIFALTDPQSIDIM